MWTGFALLTFRFLVKVFCPALASVWGLETASVSAKETALGWEKALVRVLAIASASVKVLPWEWGNLREMASALHLPKGWVLRRSLWVGPSYWQARG